MIDTENIIHTSTEVVDKDLIKPFARPDWRRSVWQIINSVIPMLGMFIAMYYSLAVSYWLTLLLAVPTAGLFVRIFIIFHDCGHGSFFKSHTANTIVGYITGILTFAPYHDWRFNHARHHATCSDLDRRGTGDVWTLTTGEYDALTPWKKFTYRLYRNPVVMFGLGPVWLFLISHRFSPGGAKAREKRSVYLTNLGLVVVALTASLLIGFKSYVLIQLPVILLAGTIGIWLFYVQHQYEDVYWNRHDDWDFEAAALEGSSFYKLPAVLQWFTGNIGYHHVHHLNARIPNYNLQRCHEQFDVFQQVKPLTFFSSLKSLRFRLYDEDMHRMVSFRQRKYSRDF